MNDYVLYEDLDGKYHTLKDIIEANSPEEKTEEEKKTAENGSGADTEKTEETSDKAQEASDKTGDAADKTEGAADKTDGKDEDGKKSRRSQSTM